MKISTILSILFLGIYSLSYSQKSFKQGEITDGRDGNIYQTITINNTIWLSENMKFKTENAHILNSDENDFKSDAMLLLIRRIR